MTRYYRPLVQTGQARPVPAHALAGTGLWFSHLEVLSRDAASQIIPAAEMPDAICDRLVSARQPICGLDMAQTHLMGILNVTPDSFSDGGMHNAPDAALQTALKMVEQGASIIDIGGESTRPGADFVPDDQEIARTGPVIASLRRNSGVVVSIDTRKSTVARAAVDAGANIVNDVSGFTFDAALGPYCAERGLPVCVMHAQGDPATMQNDPQYENILLDVFDFLERQVVELETIGVSRSQIIVDPGIGFGKTINHNLILLKNISLFHGLGCPILVGASRKRFIGTIGNAPHVATRAPGSVAVGLAALAQGVQMLRVHDVAETAQAVRLWNAVR